MQSVSAIRDKGTVFIPQTILQSLGLEEGNEITWNFDPQRNRAYIEKKKPQTGRDFGQASVESGIKSELLLALEKSPKTFNELCASLQVSTKTLAEYLEKCLQQDLIEHLGRNKPYSLTKRGLELLRISKSKPVEGNDIVIETVKQGPFLGSIILRLPSHLGKEFSEKLYTPTGIEDLSHIMIIGLSFWVMRHTQSSPYVQICSYGKDFNGDGIEDLLISETPKGFPNIRKALKDNKMPMPLWDYCLNAAEEKLSQS